MKSYVITMTEGAEKDITQIYQYIANHDCVENADYVLDELTRLVDDLAYFPAKGKLPSELEGINEENIRQASFKPYRVLYRIEEKNVVIMMIIDGRRNAKAALMKRLA
jgi:toxin ParE1/3/4